MVCVRSGWLLTAAHRGLPGQVRAGRSQLRVAAEPGVSTAQGHWCRTRWGLRCSEHGGRGCRGWGGWTQQQHPLPFCPADSPVPGQILTRSLGRRASPGPFLLPSGVGTQACRRGSGPGGRQSAWARQGCTAGARAPCLTGPSLPCTALSQAGQARCCPHVWPGAPAFLAREAEGCWCTANPVPGAGGALAMCHEPTSPWAWAGTQGESRRGP